MYTRDDSAKYHAYFPLPVSRYVVNGLVRVTTHKGIVQTWAITRPSSSFHPSGAPLYLAEANPRPSGALAVSGFQSLNLPPMKLETDLTNKRTWQREYRFTD